MQKVALKSQLTVGKVISKKTTTLDGSSKNCKNERFTIEDLKEIKLKNHQG